MQTSIKATGAASPAYSTQIWRRRPTPSPLLEAAAAARFMTGVALARVEVQLVKMATQAQHICRVLLTAQVARRWQAASAAVEHVLGAERTRVVGTMLEAQAVHCRVATRPVDGVS